jgi:S-adenosylmethionine uptake transporter
MLIAWGYAREETQVLLPLEYSAFIWAALLGWLMFAEALTWPTVGGAVLIVAGCLMATRKHTEQTAL